MLSFATAIDAIPLVPDASTRDALFPLASRTQNQRVFRLDTKAQERWNGSAWLVDFETAAAPADGRTVPDVTTYLANNAVFNALDFTTVPINTGVHDPCSAIQAAMDAAEAGGGGIVLCPAGTYLFQTPTGTYKVFIRPRNNVWLMGHGPGTIFRAANGLNTATSDLGFNFIRHVVADEGKASVSNFTVSDITFDHNGLNNLIPSGFVGKDNVAVGVQVGSNLRVENCTFLNNAGRQTLSFGNNVSPQSISALFIRGNYFHNMGGSVTGNTHSTDHSSIYAQTIGGEITHNILTNDNAAFNNTAIEGHCKNTTISNNNAANYSTLFNLAATIADFLDNEITENTGTGLNIAFNFYQTGSFRFEAVRIEANVFEQSATAANNFILMSNVATGIQSAVIRNNTFRSAIAAGGGGVVACLEIGLASRFDFSGNRVSGFPGRAVQLGTITAGVSLTIEDNTIIDCGTTSTSGNRGGVVLNSLNTIGYLSLQRNKVMNVAATYMTTAFGGNATITQGIAENNSVLGVASPYSGTILGLLSVFNVRQFGAKGDGTTDDTAAIQAAINAAAANPGVSGGAVYLPPGSYKITTALSLPQLVSIYGLACEVTKIVPVGCDGIHVAASAGLGPVSIRGISLFGTGLQDGFTGIAFPGTTNAADETRGTQIKECQIWGFTTGISARTWWYGSCSDTTIYNCWNGIALAGLCLGLEFTNVQAILPVPVLPWSNATAYTVGKVASLGGVSYYCILNHTNQSPPNVTYWQPLTGTATGLLLNQFAYSTGGTQQPQAVHTRGGQFTGFQWGVNFGFGLHITFEAVAFDQITLMGIRYVNGTGNVLIDSCYFGLVGSETTAVGVGLIAVGAVGNGNISITNGSFFCANAIATSGSCGIQGASDQGYALIQGNYFQGFAAEDIQLNGDYAGCHVLYNRCTSVITNSIYLNLTRNSAVIFGNECTGAVLNAGIPLAQAMPVGGTAAPTTNAHVVGEVVWNSAPAAGGTMGWVCTTAGTPGTWKTFGAISA